MTPIPTPTDVPTGVIAERLLTVLRDLKNAADPTLAQTNSAYGYVYLALLDVLDKFHWGRHMAIEAINHALDHNTTMREAMLAVQA